MQMRTIAPLLLAAGVALALVGCTTDTSSSDSSAPATTADTSTPASTLAEKTGESEHAVQAALDRTETVCNEGESDLAREVSNSIDDLTNNGISENAVPFLNAVHKAARPIAPTDCVQIQAGLLVLMEQ